MFLSVIFSLLTLKVFHLVFWTYHDTLSLRSFKGVIVIIRFFIVYFNNLLFKASHSPVRPFWLRHCSLKEPVQVSQNRFFTLDNYFVESIRNNGEEATAATGKDMDQEEDFNRAAALSHTLKTKPTNDELLEIYSLYKQASVGDINVDKPGIFDVKTKFKWEAWNRRKGMTQEEARLEYIKEVEKLAKKYGTN